MEERHGRNADESDERSGSHSERVKARKGKRENEYGPNGADEEDNAMKFLPDGVRVIPHDRPPKEAAAAHFACTS